MHLSSCYVPCSPDFCTFSNPDAEQPLRILYVLAVFDKIKPVAGPRANYCFCRLVSHRLWTVLCGCVQYKEMAPFKRNHKTLTIQEKSVIIDELNRGVSGKSLALRYGVGTSTISDIKKNANKLKG